MGFGMGPPTNLREPERAPWQYDSWALYYHLHAAQNGQNTGSVKVGSSWQIQTCTKLTSFLPNAIRIRAMNNS